MRQNLPGLASTTKTLASGGRADAAVFRGISNQR